ncbi:MAG: ABC transporter ATP-binding protein [Planctomycetes bacterium]|nr:ABC transporter ATP-binding protein [Planctomycetota bacterium]
MTTPAETKTPAAVLKIENVRFGYERDRAIVEGLSAGLRAGRVTVLLGPNAAGKSTLVKLMLGQLAPWSGAVTIDGKPVGSMSPRGRAAVMSYVPQRATAGFAFTVEEVVAMGLYAAAPSPGAVEEAIRGCDLVEVRGRVFNHLSFGQQQRVLLARAVAQSAGGGRVMLLDEPGSAMDLWHVHQMMGRLAAQARRGMAVLVVLHDLNLAARYADEVWLMDGGKMAAMGAWPEVLTAGVLEPVYRVRLEAVAGGVGGRPVFRVEPSDTLMAEGAR